MYDFIQNHTFMKIQIKKKEANIQPQFILGVPPTFRGKHALSKFRYRKTRFLYVITVIDVTKLIFVY